MTAKRSPLLPGWTSWLAATTLPMLAVGVSASAALHVIAADRDATVPAAPGAAGRYESEDHFPGAAAFYAAGDEASAAPGTTGTTALPTGPMPTDTAFDPLDGTVRPALPFSTAAGSTIDRGRALQCLTAAIYYEAASESDDGQRAVAQVVLNRVRHPAFPATVCGVVYQGSDQPTGCQFSFACDGALTRIPAAGAWSRALRIAAAALAGRVFAPVGLATHYHTFAVTPAWNRTLVMTDAIGAHFFHRWKGYWGTPAAFHQRYVGGEPLPGPIARPPVVPVDGAVMALAGAAPVAADPAGATVPPAAVPAPAPPVVAAAPQSGDVLDRWKDAGQPLR